MAPQHGFFFCSGGQRSHIAMIGDAVVLQPCAKTGFVVVYKPVAGRCRHIEQRHIAYRGIPRKLVIPLYGRGLQSERINRRCHAYRTVNETVCEVLTHNLRQGHHRRYAQTVGIPVLGHNVAFYCYFLV